MKRLSLENQYDAVALYDGGWRADDIDQLREEYDLTDDEAKDIAEKFMIFEGRSEVW